MSKQINEKLFFFIETDKKTAYFGYLNSLFEASFVKKLLNQYFFVM